MQPFVDACGRACANTCCTRYDKPWAKNGHKCFRLFRFAICENHDPAKEGERGSSLLVLGPFQLERGSSQRGSRPPPALRELTCSSFFILRFWLVSYGRHAASQPVANPRLWHVTLAVATLSMTESSPVQCQCQQPVSEMRWVPWDAPFNLGMPPKCLGKNRGNQGSVMKSW